MSVIRTSPRALFLALLPLAILHAMLMANGIAPIATSALPIPDWALIVFLGRLSLEAALLFLGHMRLRALGVHGRGAYGIMGGFAAAISYLIAYRLGLMLSAPAPGTVLTVAVLPVVIGMLGGFLYAQFAGREVVVLADADADTTSPARPALFTYDGPVQVRTSIAASAMAAAIPALITSIPAVTVLLAFLSGTDGTGGSEAWAVQLALPAQMILTTLFVIFVPSLIVIGATHALARAFRRTRGIDYALIGAAMGAIGSLLLIALLNGIVFILLLGAAVGAIMGAVYRRFAGIEPLALPEDVLADDLAALVPQDHPARKSHAVVFNR